LDANRCFIHDIFLKKPKLLNMVRFNTLMRV